MPNYSKIADAIEEGKLSIKQIAHQFNVSRRVVEGVKARYFETTLTRKDPLEGQTNLFQWAGLTWRGLKNHDRKP